MDRQQFVRAITLGAIAALSFGSSAFATDFIVNSNADTFDPEDPGSHYTGTLRHCIYYASRYPGPNRVDLTGVSGTIKLTSDLGYVEGDVALIGPGAAALTIDGDNLYRIFNLGSNSGLTSHTITGLTLKNGMGSGKPGAGGGAGMGGAIFDRNAGNIILNDVVFTTNQAIGGNGMDQFVDGGGFAYPGTADSSLALWLYDHDLAYYGGSRTSGTGGGGVGRSGSFGGGGGASDLSWGGPGGFGGGGGGGPYIDNTYRSGKGGFGGGMGPGGGAGFGAALFLRKATCTATNCTFSDNLTSGGASGGAGGTPGQGYGGAIFVHGGTLNLINCTFSNNTAIGGEGSDLYSMLEGTTVTVTNTVVAHSAPPVHLRNNELAGPVLAMNSLFKSAFNKPLPGTGNIMSPSPQFHSPMNLRPLPSSPLIAAGTIIGAPARDLDGNVRPVSAPTIGAYEGLAASPAATYAVTDPSGATALGTTGAEISLGAVSGEVTAQLYTAGRSGSVPAPNGSPYFWTLSTTAASISGSIKFNWAALAGNGGVSDPASVQLYKRDGYGLPWTLVSGTTHDSNSIIATGITGFSEFALGSGPSNALPVTLSSWSLDSL